jgi:hypothetical protein
VAFYQSDSINTTTNAYVETRFRTNTLTMVLPEVSFGIDDQVKFIAVGVSATQAGFLSASFTLLAGTVPVMTSSFHTYQLRKFGADSIQLWIAGLVTRAGRIRRYRRICPSRHMGSISDGEAPA